MSASPISRGVEVSYAVPVNTTVFQPQANMLVIRAFRVVNQSGANVIVSDLIDVNPYVVPPGGSQTFNLPHNAYQIRANTDANTTGNVVLTLYDSPQDTSGNTPGQQPPGTIAISSGVVTIASGVITLSGPVDIAAGQSVQITGTVTAQDVLVESNTGILTGLLPSNTQAFTVANGASHAVTVPNAVPGFGLTVQATGAGRLNCNVLTNSQIVWLLRDVPFYNGPNTNAPLEKRFAVPIQAGGIVNLLWDDATAAITAIVRL